MSNTGSCYDNPVVESLFAALERERIKRRKHRTHDDAYMEKLHEVLAGVRGFTADVLVVALGLDASEHDPLAFLKITTAGFRRIGEALGAMGIPTVLVQEGGYLSEHLGADLAAALAGRVVVLAEESLRTWIGMD